MTARDANYGDFSKSMITDIPANLSSEEALYYHKTIPKFAGEAVYVYSFKENRMIYANGWEEILGYPDNEINMLKIVSITSEEHAKFSNAINDEALKFLSRINKDLEAYSFSIELKKIHSDGSLVPLISRVGVLNSENGQVKEIIGRSQVNHGLKFGEVMKYEAYGPEKSEFEEELSKSLFSYAAISKKESEALKMVANGYSFRQIAISEGVSHSAIEKRILPLYKRFEVQSLSHLVSFAHKNHIL